jgi:hypothetical protein
MRWVELQNQYSTYKNTLQQLASKIGDVEQEAEEHKFSPLLLVVLLFLLFPSSSSWSYSSFFCARSCSYSLYACWAAEVADVTHCVRGRGEVYGSDVMSHVVGKTGRIIAIRVN